MRLGGEAGDAGGVGAAEWVEKLLIPVRIGGHVLFHDALPAALAWGVGVSQVIDLFTGFENASVRRVAGLGLFLSAIAAIITTESVTALARPFSVGQFVATVIAIGVALFPTLADWQRIHLGLTPPQFALIQSYSYLAVRVLVGILIGATVSWVLLSGYMSIEASSSRPHHSRK